MSDLSRNEEEKKKPATGNTKQHVLMYKQVLSEDATQLASPQHVFAIL